MNYPKAIFIQTKRNVGALYARAKEIKSEVGNTDVLDPNPMPVFLDRTKLVYTYTNMNTYENICPYQFFRRYIVKDIAYAETSAMKFGNAVHAAFEHRIRGGKPLPDEMRQWEPFATAFDNRGAKVELKLGIKRDGSSCGYWDDNVFLRGKIDCVAGIDNVAFVADWKTGSSRFEDPFELEVGALLLRARLPVNRIQGAYAWLRENRMGQVYDLSDFERTWSKINRIAREIERDRIAGEFEKRPSGLCGWCDVTDCEHNKKGR